MTTLRSEQDQSALAAAADYVRVYTRPMKAEIQDVPRLNRGCFNCNHSTPSMSLGQYVTIFGLLMQHPEGGPPEFKKKFGITVCFEDKAWNVARAQMFKLCIKAAYQKFPFMHSTYVTVGQLLDQENPYVRIAALGDQPSEHINSRVNVQDLLGEGEFDKHDDLVLVSQPMWQVNAYVDPSWDIDNEPITLEAMRFARPQDRDAFVSGWIKTDPVDLTPVKGLKSQKTRGIAGIGEL